jgi:hypothetical protein
MRNIYKRDKVRWMPYLVVMGMIMIGIISGQIYTVMDPIGARWSTDRIPYAHLNHR